MEVRSYAVATEVGVDDRSGRGHRGLRELLEDCVQVFDDALDQHLELVGAGGLYAELYETQYAPSAVT